MNTYGRCAIRCIACKWQPTALSSSSVVKEGQRYWCSPGFFLLKNALIQNKLFDGWKKNTLTHTHAHTHEVDCYSQEPRFGNRCFITRFPGFCFLRSFVFSSVKRESRLFTNVKIVLYLKAFCFKFYPLEVSNYFLILFLIQRTMLANANPRAFSAVSSRFSSTEAWNQRKYAQFKGGEQKEKNSARSG